MKRVSSSVPSLEQCHGPVSRRVSVTRRQRRDSGPWHIDLQMSRRLSRRPVVPSLFRPTDDLLLPHENNIEDMWLTFKNVLHSSVEQFIPKNNNFSLCNLRVGIGLSTSCPVTGRLFHIINYTSRKRVFT